MPANISLALLALAAATPWLSIAPVLYVRMRGTPSLDDLGAAAPGAARVSIVLPARNEAAHIAECLRSLRASSWPALEIIVVNDGSTDGTADLARSAADGDPRVTVVDAPPLPAGWFGKQWACHTGAGIATGMLLLFTDADTRHARDLVHRAVTMHALRGADLLSVAGRQDMETFWERAVQPLIFGLIVARYGGARQLESATRASDVIANGQCFLVTRAMYDAVGGHERLRQYVAEDLMMAQAVWSHGGRVSLALGPSHLRTRMYDGLPALVKGWSKNVYAGGRHAVRGGRAGRMLYPLLLMIPPFFALAPFAVFAAIIAGVAGAPAYGSGTSDGALALLMWSTLAILGTLVAAAALNRANGDPWYRAPYVLPGAVLLAAICALAIARGSGVSWKDRDYTAQ